MPISTDANSPSIKLAAKIGACRKFENRTPSKGSYLFQKSPRNQSSSLNPFARANTSRYGVRKRKSPGAHSCELHGHNTRYQKEPDEHNQSNDQSYTDVPSLKKDRR